MGKRRVVWIAGTAGLVLAVGAGYAVADARDLVPGPLTTADPWEEPSPYPTPSEAGPVLAPDVLAAWDLSAPLPSEDVLASMVTDLAGSDELGGGVGVVVSDVATGTTLASSDPDTPRKPASTTKMLTGAAVVATLDLSQTIPTDAALEADVLYLVGHGDMALATGAGNPDSVVGRAGLGDLADQVAERLSASGISAVTLRVDDTAFERVPQAVGWSSIDFTGGYVAPIQALGVDIARVDGQIQRDGDPAMSAAVAFAAALGERGIDITDGPTREAAPQTATQIARVNSAPIGELLDFAMAESSNTLTEVLGRLVAIESGEPVTFEGATRAVLDALANLGLDVSGTTLTDTCGLSSQNRISPSLLTNLVLTTAQDPAMFPLARSLPVSGLEGTLEDRWLEGGIVRAKTGTLQNTVSLSGYVTTADGRLLAFAVMSDAVPDAGTYQARLRIDEFVNDVADCGCR